MKRRLPTSLLLVAALLLPAACTTVTNPVTGRAERTVMDEAAEVAEGRKAHQQVLAEYGAYPDAKLQGYVDGVGQRLAQQSHRAGLSWTFTVLDSPEVNAFALPGGYVYVTRGIMAYLDSEADLAGVLGHEIGHVTARHGAQRATRQQAAGIGVLAASVLGIVLEGAGLAGAGELAGQAAQGVAAGYIASYSREQELQADQLGAEYLARNGYDPQHMVGVIGVLQKQERFDADAARAEGRAPAAQADWLSSHPSNEQRLQEIARIAASVRAGKAGFGDDRRAAYLQAIDGMTFGESREQGVTRGRHFYHEPLGIALSAPAGWSVQNASDAITLVNRERDAGLIVRLMPPAAGRSHDEILRNVVRPQQGQTERTTVGNGLPATRFAGIRAGAQGQAQRVELTLVTGPGERHYLLQRAARDGAALQRARPAMQEAEQAFRALSAAERAAARPWVLRTVPYRGGGWQPLAQRSPLPAPVEPQLRLLNGLYPDGEPKPGQLLKVVE